MLSMFETLTDEEMKALFNIVAKLEHRANELYENAKATRLSQANSAENG